MTDYICADCGGGIEQFHSLNTESIEWVCDGCGNAQLAECQEEKPYWVVERGHLLIDFVAPGSDGLVCRVPVSKELVRILRTCGVYFKNAIGLGGVTISKASDAEPQLVELRVLLSKNYFALKRISPHRNYSARSCTRKVSALLYAALEFPNARIETSETDY
jgi:hypothetical protein